MRHRQAHEHEAISIVKTRLLIPVCDAIETQLRLHHHSITVFPTLTLFLPFLAETRILAELPSS